MAWSPSPSPGGPSRALRAPSALKILAAGLSKDERGPVEATVRQALGSRSDPWVVSLVKLAGKWSVTLNGPGERFRNLSFTADETRLGEAIREAVGADGPAAAPAREAPPVSRPAPAAARVEARPGEVRDRHDCPHCGRAVLVVYESQPDEPKTPAALACPHCWQKSRVEVGAWAAAGGDYRAEKA
jgi:hypothetical protein